MSEWQVIKAVKAENYQGGVKITATDLRDVFATVVMDNVESRHGVPTQLEFYLRRVEIFNPHRKNPV